MFWSEESSSSLCVKGSEQMLTALDGMGGDLEGDVLSSGLRNVHTEHQANTRVLPPHVRLALPQLDVGVPQLQDPDTVDSGRGGAHVCVSTGSLNVAGQSNGGGRTLTWLSCCSSAPGGSPGPWCRGRPSRSCWWSPFCQ